MKTNLKDLRNSINGRCMSLINDGWYNCGDLLEHDLTNFINEKLFLYDIKDEFKIDYYFSLDDLEKLLIWAKNDIGIDYKIILDINNLLWNNNNVSNNNKKYINDFNIDIITTICNKFASTVIHMFYDYDYDTLSNDKYIDYMNKKIDNKNKEIEKLIEALLWCSGSQDFAPGGIARNGWAKLCQPLLQKYLDEETLV